MQRTVEGFKNGNTAVFERGHTVVLNVNSTTENLLRQVRVNAGCRCDCFTRAGGGDVHPAQWINANVACVRLLCNRHNTLAKCYDRLRGSRLSDCVSLVQMIVKAPSRQ